MSGIDPSYNSMRIGSTHASEINRASAPKKEEKIEPGRASEAKASPILNRKMTSALDVLKFNLQQSKTLALLPFHAIDSGMKRDDPARVGWGILSLVSLPFTLALGGVCSAISVVDATKAALTEGSHLPLLDFRGRAMEERHKKSPVRDQSSPIDYDPDLPRQPGEI